MMFVGAAVILSVVNVGKNSHIGAKLKLSFKWKNTGLYQRFYPWVNF